MDGAVYKVPNQCGAKPPFADAIMFGIWIAGCECPAASCLMSVPLIELGKRVA